MFRYVDLSHSITERMPTYPGDPPVSLRQSIFLATDHFNGFTLQTGLHVGTHLDFPLHLIEGKPLGCSYPLDLFCGPGRLIEAPDQVEITLNPVWETVQEGEIVLLRTGWDQHFGSELYYLKYPHVTPELAAFLVQKKIKLLGLDTPSPDYPPMAIHKLLLGAGICIIENLTRLDSLAGIEEFEVFAVPLKLSAEASLIRAFARYKVN